MEGAGEGQRPSPARGPGLGAVAAKCRTASARPRGAGLAQRPRHPDTCDPHRTRSRPGQRPHHQRLQAARATALSRSLCPGQDTAPRPRPRAQTQRDGCPGGPGRPCGDRSWPVRRTSGGEDFQEQGALEACHVYTNWGMKGGARERPGGRQIGRAPRRLSTAGPRVIGEQEEI